ncbi:molybdopterin synthase catalytic subunit [Nitrosophilus kaiyonis]|uniref:molybdopterin synthase catalytic subunit n=1 Tax=Nitrosophilus kaiyonis TaxID=2930200 RepID=UPI002490D1D9|nr:molybdenum cofactor biosynthesis protein MoaE [Nitrosophilus kaiyonis]
MIELYDGPLDVDAIFSSWRRWGEDKNFGAFITFVGTVREENDIEALSFDVYKPILKSWFDNWQEKAQKRGAFLKMAHSIGDVPVHTSSYMAAVFSPKRRVALELIDEFVEDFKANAPIWKYDVINKKRVYAKDRSQKIKGAGILDIGH